MFRKLVILLAIAAVCILQSCDVYTGKTVTYTRYVVGPPVISGPIMQTGVVVQGSWSTWNGYSTGSYCPPQGQYNTNQYYGPRNTPGSYNKNPGKIKKPVNYKNRR